MKSLFSYARQGLSVACLSWAVAESAFAQYPGPMAPAMPASPLAGGMAAAGGGQFVDAHGNAVVVPASYCGPEGCMADGGYGDPSACYGDPGGCYGDPAACYGGAGEAYADFGGYSMPDQCGPHYFDVSFGAIFLQGEGLFKGAPALGSIGVNGTRILNPDAEYNDFETGWQIAGRLDFGPLSVLEATYFGIYDVGFNQTIRSVDVSPGNVQFQLNTVFSDYGVTPIDGLDEGDVYTLNYAADLQSTELSYRRYWLGASPRISGTYLLGFRYLRFAEQFAFNAVALNGNGSITADSSNDLLGFQVGGDGWLALRQGLRIGGDLKSGIYNNRFEFGRGINLPGTGNDVTSATSGNQVAFAAEGSLDLVADILPSWSLRGGYQVLYMNSLATVGTNIPSTLDSTALTTQSDALFHGFRATLEYIW